MNRYDEWTESRLRTECMRRGINPDGKKPQLAKRVADRDEEKQQAKARRVFDQLSDPDGKKEQAYLDSQADFDRNYWNSVLGSELEFYETMAKGKKTELIDALKRVDTNHLAAVGIKELRVAGYKGVTGGSEAPTSASKGSALVTKNATSVPSYSGPAQELVTKTPTPQPTATQEATPILEKVSLTATIAPIPTVKKVYEPMPFVESAFHKAPPKKTPTTNKQSSAKATDVAPDPAVKKVYEPMPFVESAFHRAPPAKVAGVRKPRAKKAAPEPEPKPAPKKFMTETGVALLKTLGGPNDIDYEKFVEPSKNKRPLTEAQASLAKKLRQNPEDIIRPDVEHYLLEDDVQSELFNVGYLFLSCENEENIRGGALASYRNEYKAFAITELRADKTGYFMVFEKTAKGDRDLKKCFKLINIELEEKSLFDKNVAGIKIVKRDDAVSEPDSDSESELEPEPVPEPKPELEEVNLGYTYVPSKKPAPRRGRWGR